jgi:hypothetical protein
MLGKFLTFKEKGMDVYLPGESIERYYEVMRYRNLDDQINAEVNKYVHLCERASRHNPGDEDEYREMAHTVFYHIQELRSTGKPSPLIWFN